MKQNIIMRVEPSKRLSELCGFPYFLEYRFTRNELLEKGIINEDDVSEMESGKEICRKIPIRGNNV